jgi:ketosteroid isomerase-like protein
VTSKPIRRQSPPGQGVGSSEMATQNMHPHADVLTRLFTALDRHDHTTMADCYDEDATFTDIAFDLHGKKRIHAMWHMICEGDIRASFEIVKVDDGSAVVKVVDDYTFRSKGRKVHNVIQSHFRLRNGSIIDQQDACDARQWAAMALGGVGGFLAGRLPFLVRGKARKTLDAFIEEHPAYGRN